MKNDAITKNNALSQSGVVAPVLSDMFVMIGEEEEESA